MSDHRLITLALMSSSILAAPTAASARAPGDSAGQQLRVARSEIAALKVELDALRARVDALAQGSASAIEISRSEARATNAEARAQAADAKASLALGEAQAASTKADAEMKSPPMPKALAWAGDTHIGGRIYLNASHVSHDVNGATAGNADNGGGMAIKRLYVTIDHKFDATFAANVTMDVDNVAGTSGNLVGRGFFIKKAYLEAKLDPAFTVRAGSADMAWLPYVEGLYGYRHIEKTFVDRINYGTTADWGVHVLGSLASGIISYQVSAVGGGTYRDVHFSHGVDFEGRISAQYNGFNVAVGGYTGKLGKALEGAVPLRTYNRLDALAAYSGNARGVPVTLGLEYLYAKNKAFNASAPLALSSTDDSSKGWSAFASVSPANKWSVFGKVERLKPSADLHPSLTESYFNVGIQYSPLKLLDLALVYKHDHAANGALATGDLQLGAIGCAAAATTTCTGEGTYDELGLYAQVRF